MVKCKVCGREFGLPLHLGRHMAAAHASAAKTPKAGARKVRRTRRKATSRTVTAMGGQPDVTATLSACCSQLADERARLDAQIDAMQAALTALGSDAAMGAKPRAGRRGQRAGGFRPGSLKDYIVRVVREAREAMPLPQIVSAVRQAGYKSRAKHLKAAIGNAIGGLKGVRRVGRGLYGAR